MKEKYVYDGETVKAWVGSSQWRAWRADLMRFQRHGYSGWGSDGFWMLTVYRIRRGLQTVQPKWAAFIPRLIIGVIKKLLTMLTHVNVHPDASIGPGLLIPHVGPIQIFQWATIGADCAIHQVCTVSAGSKPGGPTIGNHVMLGCHCCILGPMKIGDRVSIGAGAVVVTDIPSDSIATGIPAKARPIKRS